MPSSVSPIPLNTREDISHLRSKFSDAKRLQIKNFLSPKDAKILRSKINQLPWRLVLNENGKHLDIHHLQLKQIPSAKLREIKQAAQLRATSQFQYLFENYPVHDVLKSGKSVDATITSIYHALNSETFLGQLSDLTNLPLDYCDMQATRYRAGHFLTTHDDGIEGKNRQLAYVINLSERWRESWGGNLSFTDQKGHSVEKLTPIFNSLSLFQVPQLHEVTQVKPSAKSSRLSLTGWFRVR